jgi:hypothetical protein
MVELSNRNEQVGDGLILRACVSGSQAAAAGGAADSWAARASGQFSVRVAVPGVGKTLTASVTVEPDPLPKFSGADRSARQLVLMRVYEWTKALGDARVAARSLVGQRDSIATDLGAGRADSLNVRIARVSANVDRALTRADPCAAGYRETSRSKIRKSAAFALTVRARTQAAAVPYRRAVLMLRIAGAG